MAWNIHYVFYSCLGNKYVGWSHIYPLKTEKPSHEGFLLCLIL
jgi:hypothetical protein